MPKHQVIYAQGTPPREMFFIKSGKVSLILTDTTEDFPFMTQEGGDYFGEIEIILKDVYGRRLNTIKATDHCDLLKLSYEAFRSIFM